MVTVKDFNTVKSGDSAKLYTIDSGKAKASVTDFGATLVSFIVPDKNSVMTDICLGYDGADGYDNDRNTYFGATVGRFANRIKGARFMLNNKEYTLPKNNNGKHCLHGGTNGFSFRMYEAQYDDSSVTFSILSPDGEEGFPGNMKFSVKYTLIGTELSIEYFAESDKDTVAVFTNHSYFNLNGATSGKSAINHTLYVNADKYAVVDSDAMFTGVVRSVEGTGFDFREPTLLGSRLPSEHPDFAPTAGGIDNFFASRSARGKLYHSASLSCPDNGIALDCYTDQVGVQVYTARFTNAVGKQNTEYIPFCGVCLETGSFPDSPNLPNFPSPFLSVGEKYYSKTVYVAGIK